MCLMVSHSSRKDNKTHGYYGSGLINRIYFWDCLYKVTMYFTDATTHHQKSPCWSWRAQLPHFLGSLHLRLRLRRTRRKILNDWLSQVLKNLTCVLIRTRSKRLQRLTANIDEVFRCQSRPRCWGITQRTDTFSSCCSHVQWAKGHKAGKTRSARVASAGPNTHPLSHSSHVVLRSGCPSSQWPCPWGRWCSHTHCFNSEGCGQLVHTCRHTIHCFIQHKAQVCTWMHHFCPSTSWRCTFTNIWSDFYDHTNHTWALKTSR